MNKNTDKRKLSSPANGRQSKGPKTEAGKARAAQNALKHGAYSRKILFPGEDEQALHEMTYALWRSLRQAPAQASLVSVQMLRMAPAVRAEFQSVTAEDLHALAGAALGPHGPQHLTREEIRLTYQYENLRRQFMEIRAITPPPDPPEDNPDSTQPQQTKPPSENAETNLNPGLQPTPSFNPNAEAFSFLPPVAVIPIPKEAPPSPPTAAHATR